jgi:hypothetical protein
MEHRQHRVLRFNINIGREIARVLLQALQRGPEVPPHHGRTCLSYCHRDVTVVHADAP